MFDVYKNLKKNKNLFENVRNNLMCTEFKKFKYHGVEQLTN